jgi:hypothetical protein
MGALTMRRLPLLLLFLAGCYEWTGLSSGLGDSTVRDAPAADLAPEGPTLDLAQDRALADGPEPDAPPDGPAPGCRWTGQFTLSPPSGWPSCPRPARRGSLSSQTAS